MREQKKARGMSKHDSGSETYIAQSLPRAQRDRPRQPCGIIDLFAPHTPKSIMRFPRLLPHVKGSNMEKYLWRMLTSKFSHMLALLGSLSHKSTCALFHPDAYLVTTASRSSQSCLSPAGKRHSNSRAYFDCKIVRKLFVSKLTIHWEHSNWKPFFRRSSGWRWGQKGKREKALLSAVARGWRWECATHPPSEQPHRWAREHLHQ